MRVQAKSDLVLARVAALAAAVVWAAGCSQPPPSNASATAKVSTPAPPPGNAVVNAAANAEPPVIVAPPPAVAQPAAASDAASPPAGQAIDRAQWAPASSGPVGYDPALVRFEVLLDRAGFSPGAIDGKTGANLDHAIAAYAQARGLDASGDPGPAAWRALTGADAAPIMQAYVITDTDEAGPFIGPPPKDYRALARLPALAYASPKQELAERFHMDPNLLTALNPGVDFSHAGQSILVAAPREEPRAYAATRVEVDKTGDEVRAYGADGALLAAYPASVGSTERPAPSGDFAVTAVAPHPAYYYDPARLTFTPTGARGKLRIAPGPNNPVGSTWIALTIPTYGIHGSPDATLVGKRQSHGCVRLTNWDAVELGKAVRKGTEVNFVGAEAGPSRPRATAVAGSRRPGAFKKASPERH
jgi:lipoprotein-anchoring transpeptidase ErfK/SrfK